MKETVGHVDCRGEDVAGREREEGVRREGRKQCRTTQQQVSYGLCKECYKRMTGNEYGQWTSQPNNMVLKKRKRQKGGHRPSTSEPRKKKMSRQKPRNRTMMRMSGRAKEEAGLSLCILPDDHREMSDRLLVQSCTRYVPSP